MTVNADNSSDSTGSTVGPDAQDDDGADVAGATLSTDGGLCGGDSGDASVAEGALPESGGDDDGISDDAVVTLIAERDEYLDGLQRLKAEFANFRRRSDEQAEARRAQAATDLVERLLPVLDSCEAALDQGIEQVRPIRDAFFDVLSGQGLSRIGEAGTPFDPECHEAVLYEEGEGEQIVAEILRAGYSWKERVLRPAMVKVKG